MYLHSLASAFPATSVTQPECWDMLRASGAFDRLRPRSRDLLERILLGDSGIATRRFAPDDLARVFSLDAEGLHRAFERSAPRLAADAVAAACAKGGLAPSSLDALIVCSCTGYLCPGVSSYTAERLGLRPGTYLQDLLGLGCGAALPMLESARGHLALHPGALVATVAVEVCSAAFYLDDDPGVLISLCLFGDGAAAAVWSGEDAGGRLRMNGFETIHRPEHREKIRFVNAGGKLKNQLHRSVPALAAESVGELYDRRSGGPVEVISHTGGRDVIDALRARLPAHPLLETGRVLRDYGNISSPCVLVALEQALAAGRPGPFWLTSFGAGFSAHSCDLARDGAFQAQPPPM
jgi:alkylresorcinol/alkylpyrone synthase